MRLHGVIGAIVMLGLLRPVCGQGVFDQVKLAGTVSAPAALAQVAQQTGVRIGGLNTLSSERRFPLQYDGGLAGALRYVSSVTGAIVARVGLYDYLAFAPPAVAPAPGAAASIGDLTIRAAAPVCPIKPGTRELDEPRRVVLELRVEADSDMALGSLQRLDLTTVSVMDDTGAKLEPLTALSRPVDWRRRRMGHLQTLAFRLPVARARSATVRGELLRYEEVTPVLVEFEPQAPSAVVDRAGVKLRLARCQRFGETWAGELTIRRELALGEDEPWVDLAVRGSDQRLYRPRDLALRPADDVEPRADGEERAEAASGTACRFDVALPRGVNPTRLVCQVLARRRPWARVPFSLSGLQLPELRLLGLGAPQ